MLRNVTFLVGLQAAVDFSMCQQLYQPSLLWHGWKEANFAETSSSTIESRALGLD